MLFTDKHQKKLVEYYSNKEFTVQRPKWITRIENIAREGRPESVLDYGAGVAQQVANFTDLPVTNYDPIYTPKATVKSFKPFDLVVCNHVLEHVEEKCLQDVLKHIAMLTKGAAYISVGLGPAIKYDLAGEVAWKVEPRSETWWQMKLHDELGHVAKIASDEKEVAFIWVNDRA